MYRSVIIGCGLIAGGYDQRPPTLEDESAWTATHAGGYRLCDKTTLIAAADPNHNARQQFGEKWSLDNLYEDYVEMLKVERPDIVSLCLPTNLHETAFIAAVDAGAKGIFLEKPIAANLQQSQNIMNHAGNTCVSVNFSRRFNPSFADIASAIAEQRYGRALNAVFRYTKGLIVSGSHHIDTARWFFGEPEKLETLKVHPSQTDDPGVDFQMTFANDLDAYFLHVPDADFVFFDIEIMFESGRLRIIQRGHETIFDPIEKEPHFGRFNTMMSGTTHETSWKSVVTNAIDNLINCLQTGAATSCTLHDGFRTAEIIDQLKR